MARCQHRQGRSPGRLIIDVIELHTMTAMNAAWLPPMHAASDYAYSQSLKRSIEKTVRFSRQPFEKLPGQRESLQISDILVSGNCIKPLLDQSNRWHVKTGTAVLEGVRDTFFAGLRNPETGNTRKVDPFMIYHFQGFEVHAQRCITPCSSDTIIQIIQRLFENRIVQKCISLQHIRQ